MQSIGKKRIYLILLLFGLVTAIGWGASSRLLWQKNTPGQGRSSRAAPVEVAPVTSGPIELRRIFSGTLEARAEFVVAPKVSGHVERLNVNLSDPVQRGQVVRRSASL